MDETPRKAPWYLVGLPGSGKSRVGRELAALFDVPHVDIDSLIENEDGRTISEIFDSEGEEAFRTMEERIILSTVGDRAVISLGGGAVLSPRTRRFLAGQVVIWIDATDKELVRRVKRKSTRPLLRKNPAWTLAKLRKERQEFYKQVATASVKSTSAPIHYVVSQILRELLGWEVATVTGTRDYRAYMGDGTAALVAGSVPPQASRAFVVLPADLGSEAAGLLRELANKGLEVTLFPHPPGERAKDLSVVAQAWNVMGERQIGRRDLVVTFGGGATTDLGGFLAATWLRGVNVVHVPSSLLAMVDAAVGSKTGINTASGKNLVGAFHDPVAVLVDSAYLATLPQEEYAAGLAEVIKAGFIGDARILQLVAEHPKIADRDWATGPGRAILAELVTRSVKLKARIVSQDRLESGMRELLNYGHTMGHAIERAEQYGLRHGEAVAIGCVFAANLAARLGRIDEETVERHRSLFASVGLPTEYAGEVEDLLAAMKSDKKVRGGEVRFALLQQASQMDVVSVSEDIVREVALSMGMQTEEEAG